jgi:hypothetical protein
VLTSRVQGARETILKAGLCSIAQDYFCNLYTPSDGDYSPIIATIPQCISPQDNTSLTAPFKEEEFRQAVFSMHPDKSPGPDGLNPGFFQKFWPLIGTEIYEACCSWLDDGSFPPTLNDTNIAFNCKSGPSREHEGPSSHFTLQHHLQDSLKSPCQSAQTNPP